MNSRSEFSQECGKYGPLRSCKAVPREPSLVGAVVVAFSTEEGREKCEGDMDGRWFDFSGCAWKGTRGVGRAADAAAGASLTTASSRRWTGRVIWLG